MPSTFIANWRVCTIIDCTWNTCMCKMKARLSVHLDVVTWHWSNGFLMCRCFCRMTSIQMTKRNCQKTSCKRLTHPVATFFWSCCGRCKASIAFNNTRQNRHAKKLLLDVLYLLLSLSPWRFSVRLQDHFVSSNSRLRCAHVNCSLFVVKLIRAKQYC